MSTGWIVLIIVVVLAIILSNIMLLKQTANMKMPSLKDHETDAHKEENPKEKDS